MTEPVDFTDPNFAMAFDFVNMNMGPSHFFISTDRCRDWKGPFLFDVEGIKNISTRTDYIVLGKQECIMFGSAAKADNKEGLAFLRKTTDGGLTWKLLSLIGPEPEVGFSIMPSTVHLKNGELVTTLRHGGPKVPNVIDAYRSTDLGKTWTALGDVTENIGGNPPSLVLLRDGRLCLTYGYRLKPSGARARISNDNGQTWGPEIILRDDGLTGDLGYPRSVQRPDGKVVTVYYFNGPEKDEDRTIQATIWEPAAIAWFHAVASKPMGMAVVDHARFFPAPKREQMMVGGKFAGSNISATEGFQPLAEITAEPKAGEWTDLQIDNKTVYRWVRYEAPPGSRGNIAELEFYAGSRKLNGAGFGSPGTLPPGGHWKTAFDGKTETFFNSEVADGQFVGLDLGEQASTARVLFAPAPHNSDKSLEVTLKSMTAGATIRYVLDGTTPGPADGAVYTSPIKLENTATLSAVAFKEGLAPSPVAYATYIVGTPPVRINSFHVGNSLTGNAARFPTFARTAGIDSRFESFLIGGAYTVKLWNAKEETEKDRFAAAYAKAVHPLDHFTMQPRDFNIDEEVEYELKFLNFVREKSPDVQPWLYAEWVEMNRQRPSDKGLVPSYQMTKVFPAETWEESMSAMLLYVEEVQHRVNARDKAGKRARILPCSLALGLARNLVDTNQLPGVPPGQASFYHTFFEDMVHVNPNGCYLVDLIWYAAFTGQSPEGRLLPVGTTLTPAQAKLLQHLAWEIVKNYPDCGLYAEGSTPVDRPRMSLAAGPIAEPTPIHLTCTTPGVFYRYTLDGTIPTRTRGYVYCGVITVRPGMTVKALAYQSGMADSQVAEAIYLNGKDTK